MKVTVHAEGSAKEIAAQLMEHAGVYGGVATTGPSPKTGGKAGKKGKDAPAEETEEEEEFDLGNEEEETEEEPETEEETETEEEPETEEEEEGPTADDIVEAFQKYAKKNSRDAAAKVLKSFKVKSVRELKKADYAKVLKALKK